MHTHEIIFHKIKFHKYKNCKVSNIWSNFPGIFSLGVQFIWNVCLGIDFKIS